MALIASRLRDPLCIDALKTLEATTSRTEEAKVPCFEVVVACA